MLRYLTTRPVLTLQVAHLFWGQQADSSLLCDASLPCLPALVCSRSCLCHPVLRGRGGGTHSTFLLLPLACSGGGGKAGYIFNVLLQSGSKRSSEALGQRTGLCWQCCVLGGKAPFWVMWSTGTLMWD